MKTSLFPCALLLTVTLTLCMCAAPGLAEEKPIILKLAHQAFPPDAQSVMSSNYWADLVKKRTDGKVQIKMFYDTLAKGPEAFSAAQQGGIADGVEIVLNFISPRVKDVAPMELPAAYDAGRLPEVGERIRPIMTKIMEAKGIAYVGAQYTGSALVVASRERHYRSPEDMKGQRIRIPGMWMTKAVRMWGATPTMILPHEMYNGIQTGVVDACGSILDLIALLKLYEPGPYLTEWPKTTMAMSFLGLNLKKFKSLPEKYQKIIIQSGIDAEKYSLDYGSNFENKLREKLKATPGVKYLVLSEKEVNSFLEPITGPLYKEARAYCGPLGNELMDVLDKMMNRNTH